MTYESHEIREARIDFGALLKAVIKRLPRVILVTLILLAATYVLLMFSPRLYESSASILVEPRSNIYSRAANEQAPSITGGEPGVVSSQIELIKSRDTLLKVIDQLDLRSEPEFNGTTGGGFSPLNLLNKAMGRQSTPVSVDETVLGNLYDRLTVAQERDSRLISVTIQSTDPQRAADIANAIANAHVTRRASLSLSDTAEASDWLRVEIDRLRGTVKEAETAVADFRVNNDLFTGANNTSLPDQQLSTVVSQISTAQERKNAAISRASLIRGMLDRGQSIEGVADVRDSVVIQQLSEEKARLQGERAQRSATLLSNHPVVQALNAQIGEINNQIAIEGRRVADALDAEAQIEAALEVSLQADLTRAKATASTATQDTVTLDSLQRDATAQRTLLEGYLQRYSEAFSRTETNSALPDVRVVSIAAPSVTPASPKVMMILTAVGIVATLLQMGIIAFSELMSGRVTIAGRPPERAQDELDEAPFVEAELEPDQRWEEPVSPVAVAEQSTEPHFAEPVFVTPVVAVTADEPASDIDAEPATIPEAEPLPLLQPEIDETIAPLSATSDAPGLVTLSRLVSDLVVGRSHLLLLAAHSANADCKTLAEELISDALSRGLSAALIDAGSGDIGTQLGLSDLSVDQASFGDVVNKSSDNTFAEVPWGQHATIARQSSKPRTLVEALGDIYEVVVVITGHVGMKSSLPIFESLNGRLVLVAGDNDDFDAVSKTRAQLLDAGFDSVDIAAISAREAA